MKLEKIPFISDLSDQSFTINLSGRNFLFRLIWNNSAECWILNIYHSDNNEPILLGRKLVAGIPLFGRFPDLGLPIGYLLLNHKNGQILSKEKPIFDSFKPEKGWELIYVEV